MANQINIKNKKNLNQNSTLCSLCQVENFLNILCACTDTIKLYKTIKKFDKYK